MKHNYILCILAAGMLAACSSDDTPIPDPRTEGISPIGFGVSVASQPVVTVEIVSGGTRAASAGDNAAATTPYSFRGNELVAVSMAVSQEPCAELISVAQIQPVTDTKLYRTAAGSKPALTLATEANVRKQYDYMGGTYDVNATHQWRAQSETVTLCAWSYADSTTSVNHPSGQTFSANTDQRPDGAQRELLYQQWTDYMHSAAPSLQLSLYHQMARFAVRIDQASQPVTACQAYLPVTGTFNAPVTTADIYGLWTEVGNTETILCHDHTPGVTEAPVKSDPKWFSAVAMPTYIMPNQELFSLTMADGTSYTYRTRSTVMLPAGHQITAIVNMTGSQPSVALQLSTWAEASASAEAGHPLNISVPGAEDQANTLTLVMQCVNPGATPPSTHPANASERFYLCRTEATRQLWHHVMGTSAAADALIPVAVDSQTDALFFIGRLNHLTAQTRPEGWRFSLPTDAQWKYAALGGMHSMGYTYSGSNVLSRVAVSSVTKAAAGPSRGATLQPNELGIYDMSGNMAEWTNDGHVAGGAWSDSRPVVFQPADDECILRTPEAYAENGSIGIRVALVKEEAQQ